MALKAENSAVPLFREAQVFVWWAFLVLTGVAGLMWYIAATLPNPVNILFAFIATAVTLFGIALSVCMLQMSTVVTSDDVQVWFGLIGTYRQVFPIHKIERVEVVTYNPLADFGGWGIRSGKGGERAFNARGDRGVRLHLIDNAKVLIGSQRPEELAEAILVEIKLQHGDVANEGSNQAIKAS